MMETFVIPFLIIAVRALIRWAEIYLALAKTGHELIERYEGRVVDPKETPRE